MANATLLKVGAFIKLNCPFACLGPVTGAIAHEQESMIPLAHVS